MEVDNVNSVQPVNNTTDVSETSTTNSYAVQNQPSDNNAVDFVTSNAVNTVNAPEINPTVQTDLQNEVDFRRIQANVNGAAVKPPEATVTIDGDNVTIDTGDGDDNVAVTYDAKANEVTVDVNGEKHTFTGAQAENITIMAGKGNDVIEVDKNVTVNLRLEGGEGDDRITGGAGRDYINGSLGNDTINGGDGNDVIYGGDGNDFLSGNAGNDYVEGSKGNDYVFGDEGDDMVSGGLGDDYVSGGMGNDKLYSGQGTDRMMNIGGNDTIYAQTATDTIYDAAEGSNNVVVNVELTGTPGSRSVRIEGSPEFVERVEADIEFLRSSPTGRQMLEGFDKAYDDSRDSRAGWVWPFNAGANDGNTVTIREGGNTADASNGNVWVDPQTQQRSDGADGFIYYDVRNTTLYGNDPANPNDNWNDTPPVVVLYHEMAHNYDYVTGSLQPGVYNGNDNVDVGMNNRERVAVGLPIDHDEDPATPEQVSPVHPHVLTENGLRDELGLERRPNYANPN